MRTLTPEDRREALKAFVDAPDGDLDVVDRSTLERAANCPWQAKAIADGRCSAVGLMAEAGEEAHKAFGEVLRSWIDSNGAMDRSDLRQDCEFAVRNARPDLQPEAIRAIQNAIWSWSELIYKIHPGNILAFDGGEDIDLSGQLAVDFPDLKTRFTSELDLLYQGDCPDVLEEVDYKTGWADWSTETIRDSFQFQSHAVLALEKYPDRKALRVSVFETRSRKLTYGVHFPRERIFDWKVRIRSAIEAWRVSQQDNPPCWPTTEKCGMCPAACMCPIADEQFKELADPSAFVGKIIAVKAKLDAMETIATAWVDTFGRDIQAPDGTWYGRSKPKEKKSPTSLYKIKGKPNGSNGN